MRVDERNFLSGWLCRAVGLSFRALLREFGYPNACFRRLDTVIPDFKSATLTTFLTQNVAPGATLYTDRLKASAACERLASSMCLAISH